MVVEYLQAQWWGAWCSYEGEGALEGAASAARGTRRGAVWRGELALCCCWGGKRKGKKGFFSVKKGKCRDYIYF